jgi:phosphatidate cytidylyltransferase
MLLTRVITAVVLLVILIAALAAGQPLYFQCILLVVGVVAAWEWYRLNGFDALRSSGGAIVTAGIVMALLYFIGGRAVIVLCAAATIIWIAVVLPTLWGSVLPPRRTDSQTALLGMVIVAAALLAANHAYVQRGAIYLISLLAVVFIADIAAYFVGKSIGKRKLAPAISPGKSWEGAIGGCVAVVVYGIVLMVRNDAWAQKSFPAVLSDAWGLPLAAFFLLILSGFSVVGDLFESMLKRRAGVKDSSKLLPGHGGILDRIDAQLPVLPIAALLTWGAS